MANLRTADDWDARYRDEDIPWNLGKAGSHLVDAVASSVISPCAILEIGCGTGSDAVWLAQQGFTVTATEIAPTARGRAEERARAANVDVTFLADPFPSEEASFDAAYDRAVFHLGQTAEERVAFAQSVARSLRDGGLWLSLCGSTDGPPRDHGPPRISACDITSALEPSFEILTLEATPFEADLPTEARGFWVVARKRTFY